MGTSEEGSYALTLDEFQELDKETVEILLDRIEKLGYKRVADDLRVMSL